MGTAEDAAITRTLWRFNTKRTREDMLRDIRRIYALCERLIDEFYALPADPPKRGREPGTSAQPGPKPTVYNFSLGERAKNGAVVLIDGKAFRLSPTLTALIGILASDDGQSTDEFVPFKSGAHVSEQLEKRLGRRFTNHNVAWLLTRLRDSLTKAELDRHVIERSPRSGVRLRLKRSSTDSVAR